MSKVLIGVPTTGGIAKAQTLWSVARMVACLERGGIGTEIATRDGVSVSLARDNFAHVFLTTDASHLLLVDSDMKFAPELCQCLLDARKPLIGAMYVRRQLDLAQVERNLAGSASLNEALLKTYIFEASFEHGNKVTFNGPLFRVEAIGFGFVLISRECLTTLLRDGKLPYRTRVDPHDACKPLPSFFAEIGDMTEDYSFCRRWRAIGGEVWAYASADIRHVGDFEFGLPFSQLLKLATMRAEKQPG